MGALLLLITVPSIFWELTLALCFVFHEPWWGRVGSQSMKLLKGFLEVFLECAGWDFLKLQRGTWIYIVLQIYTGSKSIEDPMTAMVFIQHFGILKSVCLRVVYGLFLLKGGFFAWDWPEDKILAVSGR